MLHFFSKVDKMNSDVVQQCFSNFKRGDKFKRLCNDYGFTVHDTLLVYIGCMISFVYSSSILVFCLIFLSVLQFVSLFRCTLFYLHGEK